MTGALGSLIRAGAGRIGEILVSEGYELRHFEDLTREDLEFFEHAEDAREISLYDDAGVYRPLKTARNLRHGWSLVLRSEQEVLIALDCFYPGARGIWQARERIGPVDLRQTLTRQSGMFAKTRALDLPQAEGIVSGLCSRCVKRILWAFDGVPLAPLQAVANADLRSDLFLCPEACNLLIDRARLAVKGAE